MSRATARPRQANRQANRQATLRPWVKPQAGVVKTRKVLADGSVRITRTSTDHHGVIRRTTTVVVPQV